LSWPASGASFCSDIAAAGAKNSGLDRQILYSINRNDHRISGLRG
jgi:hypothetical protein